MKYFSLIVLVFALISCEKECPEPEEDPCSGADLKKGLLAFYPFNGNANDASGNGNNGVLKNGAGFGKDHLGRGNSAAQFDGIDDYIVVNDNGKLNSDEMSFSVMVMVNNVDRRHALISRVKFENASAVSWGLGQSLDVTNKWDFAVDYPTNACEKLHIYDPSINVSSPEAMQAGRWYQIIGTFGKGKQNLYVDGVLKASTTRTFQSLKQCIASQLIIGGWWQNDIISIDGKIDELRIYNRVISECEIKKLSSMFTGLDF